MMRSLVFLLAFVLLPTACVTVGKLDSQGFKHEKVGYSISYLDTKDKVFINPSWKLEIDKEGRPSAKDNSIYRVDVKSFKGHEDVITVQDLDLVFKHRETNGVISVQSAPLADAVAYKKLSILARNHAERLSGLYYTSLAKSQGDFGLAKNFVTHIIEEKNGSLGSADTYEVVVDVANAEQLKLNPAHRLMRYKMVMIRPKAPLGWKDQRGVYGKNVKPEDRVTVETYPALIVLTYAMDHAFYQEYLADFEGLVSRFQLKN